MASNCFEDSWQFNKNVCQRNEHMLSKELATDVTFRVSGSLKGKVEVIRAHAYMLISASPVFWAMFCGDMREEGDVIVPDVEPEAFRQMLRFIYTNEPQLVGGNVMHVLHAAKKYQIPSLAQKCTEYLDKELKASNACSILEHSRFFNEDALIKKCLDNIEKNTVEALSSEDFLTVSNETLSIILESDMIGALDEVKIFEKCHQWAVNNLEDNKSIRDVLGENLFKIRFPVMPIHDFTDIVCPTYVLSMEEQLEIMKYMASPTNNAKPKGFRCDKRNGFCVGDKVAAMFTGDRATTFSLLFSVNHGAVFTVVSATATHLQVRSSNGHILRPLPKGQFRKL